MTRALPWLLIAAASCTPPERWPGEAWDESAPEEQGVDSARLSEVLEELAVDPRGLHSLTVVRHGVVVLDALFFPWDGARPHDVASCTKSLTGTASVLAFDGELDTPLVSLFPERTIANLDDRKRAMRLEDALTMRAGHRCVSEPFESTLVEMQASDDFVGFALDLPMDTGPGETWNYCSVTSQLVSGAVTRRLGQPVDVVLRERLFDRLQLGDVTWPRDAQGVAHGWGDARLQPRDLARVGLLLLRDGRWRDEQLLRRELIAEATRDRTGTGYGLHWWVGEGAFWAKGRGGQFLYVIPALDVVVVSTGSASPEQEATFGPLLSERLLPALRSPSALPANAAGVGRLRAALERAARPPEASAATEPPARALAVAGHTFDVDANALGWTKVAVRFDGATGTLELGVGAERASLEFGLDGVARISRAVRFATQVRFEDTDVALRGRWLDAQTLALDFDALDRIDAGTITLTFGAPGEALQLDVFERTFLKSHLAFAARW